MQACLAYFDGCDRTVEGYQGLIAAQDCLPDNETRDRFAADFSYLGTTVGGDLAGPSAERRGDRLPLARPGLRIGQAIDRPREARLARSRAEDDRTDPREHSRRRDS